MKSLTFAIRDIFLSHSGVPAPRTTRSLLAPWLCYCFSCLIVCLPVAICLTDVSHMFIDSFLALITSCTLSFHHHVSLSPPCCNAQHPESYSQNRRAPLLQPPRTLSTGLTFFNTVSLNFILGFSSFNLHHFIIGDACSGVQRFLP